MKTPADIQDIRTDLARAQTSRRRRRRWLIAAGIAAALVLFGFFGLPPIVKAQAIKHLSAALHREVTIERVRINPLVPSVTIDGLAIQDRDGGAFVAWRRLYVDFDWRSFVTGEWRFHEIALDGFAGRIVRNHDGSFNFSDLIALLASSPAAATPHHTRPLRVDRLAVTSAAVDFADAVPTPPASFATRVSAVSFTLTDFCTAADAKAAYEFTAATEAGETLTGRGTLAVNPVRSAGEFGVGGIVINKYAPYYAGLSHADVLAGKLDASGRYVIDLAAGAPVLALDAVTVKLTGLQLAERGETAPVVDLPSLIAAGVSADGIKLSAAVTSLTLDHPRLSVRRAADGTFNVLTMLAPPPIAGADTSTSADHDHDHAPLDVKIGEFSIHDLAATLVDATTPSPAKNTIEGIDLSVKNFSLADAATPLAIKFSATLPPGGTMAVAGTLVRAPLAADLTVKLVALPLAGGTPYVEPYLNLRIAGGTVSMDGHARLADEAVAFQGNVSVDNFLTVDSVHDGDFVKFAALDLEGIDLTTRPLAVKVASITQVDPVGRFIINEDKTTNLANVLRKLPRPAHTDDRKTPTAVVASAEPALAWSVDKFTQTNGKFVFIDRSVKPAVNTEIDQASGTVTGLSSSNLGRGGLDFHARVDGAGDVAVSGQVNPRAFAAADPTAATDLTLKINGVDLSPFSPYVGAYAGYELARGGLQVNQKIHLAQRRIDSENVVTLNQFTLGAATDSPLATKLPVRLGVALLKDIHGNVVIDLPVKGSLGDPDFKIGRVVLRVIVNLLVKAATSPFSLIGSMFGGGGEELSFQDFAPGSALPLPADAGKIDTLRKALTARPALNLAITGTYDAAGDTAALRARRLDRRVRAQLWEELRAKDPGTPPMDQVVVSPADSARIIAQMFASKFPAGVVIKPDGATLAVPVPLPAPVPKPMPYTRGQKPVRPAAQAPTASIALAHPIVNVSADMKVQQISGAPTLADMRSLLEAEIPVSDDDLRHLATERAEHVRAALLVGDQIAPTRLLLSPPPAQGKGTRVLLQLQ